MLYNFHKNEMINYMKELDFNIEDNKEKLKNTLYWYGYIPEELKKGLIEGMNKMKRTLHESYVYKIYLYIFVIVFN